MRQARAAMAFTARSMLPLMCTRLSRRPTRRVVPAIGSRPIGAMRSCWPGSRARENSRAFGFPTRPTRPCAILIRAHEVAVEARKNALAFVTAIRERRNGLRRGRTKERGGGQGVRAGPGNPPRNSASGDPDLRGSDRGSPTTKNWHAVPNPRMRNCSTVVIAPAP